MGELSPGSTKRRWEPEGGIQKLNERIHKESKFADDHKNLPFTFSKPTKPKKTSLFQCAGCGHTFYAPSRTVMLSCPECKNACKAEKLEAE
jgi:uncharacterized OB-fold protein